MNKNILRLLALGLALSANVVRATEIRSPMLSEHGPLRHIMQKDKVQDSQWTMWSAGYSRESHAAFLEHGVKSHSLAALVFNKDNFRMTEIFANCYVPLTAENYNPYLRTSRLVPNIRYTEQGLMMGAKWVTEGFGGRWGVRGSVALRTIEQESLQDIYGQGSRVEDVKIKTIPRVMKSDGTFAGLADRTDASTYVTASGDLPLTALRYDLAEAAFQDTARTSMLTTDGGANFLVGQATAKRNDLAFLYGFVSSPNKPVYPPTLGAFSGGTETLPIQAASKAKLQTLPLTAGELKADTVYYIPNTNANTLAPYLNFITPQGTSSPATDLAYQQMKEQLWIVPSYNTSDADPLGNLYQDMVETSLVVGLEDWLNDRGFKFEDARRAGLGDLPVELFYERELNEDLLGELSVGVRLPTGTNANYESNPLIPKTGNGQHVELKVGGMLAYQWYENISVRGDMSYSFALKATEQRAAAFQGANIKNIGPRADADISWGYFVGHIDFNFFHPKTQQYSGVLGYELYIKGKDKVAFKQSSMQSWLGGTVNTTSYAVESNKQLLSNALAAQNTDSIGHKIRFESSYRFSEYFEMFIGGSYTFAGKNLPRETDAHAGLHLTF